MFHSQYLILCTLDLLLFYTLIMNQTRFLAVTANEGSMNKTIIPAHSYLHFLSHMLNFRQDIFYLHRPHLRNILLPTHMKKELFYS